MQIIGTKLIAIIFVPEREIKISRYCVGQYRDSWRIM